MSKAFENDNIINMGLTTKQRDKVFNKYNGRCAYSGTILGSDWEVDQLVVQFCHKMITLKI